jgi:ABC-2 type transport system ATP-binding protein
MTEGSCIRVKELSKQYKGSSYFAVNKVSFDIAKGEIFGLLGPNGAGKTTFLSMLSGLLRPTNGEVEIDQYKLSEHIEPIKKIFGIVPQDIALYPALSGRDNLLFIGRMYGLGGKFLKDRVDQYLSRFGFGKNGRDLVRTYSGGMKRRINLIGGILHDPKVLLLDEPTVAMDVQTRTSIIDFLKEINTQTKMTILYTSHHMEQAELFCDRIGIMDRGEILKLGTPAGLVQQEGCRDLEEVFIKLTGRKIRD